MVRRLRSLRRPCEANIWWRCFIVSGFAGTLSWLPLQPDFLSFFFSLSLLSFFLLYLGLPLNWMRKRERETGDSQMWQSDSSETQRERRSRGYEESQRADRRPSGLLVTWRPRRPLHPNASRPETSPVCLPLSRQDSNRLIQRAHLFNHHPPGTISSLTNLSPLMKTSEPSLGVHDDPSRRQCAVPSAVLRPQP